MARYNQQLIPYRANRLPVPYGGNQSVVPYSGNLQPFSNAGSQQLMHNNVQNLAGALAWIGQPFQYIHNDGRATFTDTYQPRGNTIIYNGPESDVRFSHSYTDQPSSDVSFPPSCRFGCPFCEEIFTLKEDCERHLRAKPKFCKEHQVCHASWRDHVDRYSHTKCPISDCGRDLGSKGRFLQHFDRKH